MRPLSYIEISKSAISHNISQFKRNLPTNSSLTAVVKANAYGHGLKEVVNLINNYADAFQVDDIEELKEVRKYTKKPVYVFGYVSESNLSVLVDLNGTLGVYDIKTVERLEKIGKKQNRKIKIHLKVDAFLGRQGVLKEDIYTFVKVLKGKKFVCLDAIYSHFSDIEDVDNLAHAKRQHQFLMEVKSIFVSGGFTSLKHHISATSGFLSDLKGNWGGSMVRLGIGLYGLWPSDSLKKKFKNKINLKPVLRWVSHLAQVKFVPKNFPIGYGQTFITSKEMKIGIVPQGYSDGYDRGFSNNSFVLIKNKKCRVLGRVAMNMFAVDLSSLDSVKREDEVVLLGGEISADKLAEKIDTINYEIIARISPLLPKVIL